MRGAPATINQCPGSIDPLGPDISLVRFDGWNDSYDYTGASSWRNNFFHLFPSDYSNGYLKGTGIDTVTVMEKENLRAASMGAAAWCFDTYLPATITHAADPNEKHEFLQAGFEAYLQTSNIGLMKFWFNFIVDNRYGLSYPASNEYKYLTGANSFSTYFAAYITHPQYHRINGKPAIGLFSSGGAGTAMTLNQWQSFLSPFGGQSAVHVVQMSGSDADFTTFQCQSRFKYGIQNLTAAQGHKPFSYSSDRDKTKWTQALSGGESRVTQINLANDARAYDSAPGTRTWVDRATHPGAVSYIREALRTPGSVQAIMIWNDLHEDSGGVPPTAQDGDYLMRAMLRAKTGKGSATERYPINLANADTTIVDSSGTWTYVDPWAANTATMHDHDQVTCATANAYKAVNAHPGTLSVEIWGEQGPDRGIVEIQKDGVVQATVDCYAAVRVPSALLATVTYSTPTTGTVKARVTGTKNASSSSATIGLDVAWVTYAP